MLVAMTHFTSSRRPRFQSAAAIASGPQLFLFSWPRL